MNVAPVYLSSPRYVLGETEHEHTSIENLLRKAHEFGMPPKASIWGWGNVRLTDESLETLAVRSGLAALNAAGTAPSSVDCLVLCSTEFPGGPRTHGQFVETVMSGLGLGNAAFTGITLNRCTNLLVGLRTAQALVAAGHHRTVLVVTTDRITDESVRMENFALFSDGAAAVLVSDAPQGQDSYEIVAGASAQETRALEWTNEISSDLARAVNERILDAADMKIGDIDGVLHPNLYKPIVALKERQAGFTQEQLFLDNIPRLGHCFAADPLINLADRATAGQLRDHGHYLLVASVPGVRVGVLLRKLPAAPTSEAAATETRELR
ncbi:3-oxoacyl-[acyl-carrier-protein] synthase III C-terminal domain-containing protein [Streptomyces halobius]|uniref:3-oxoacyl-ACP synthase n=1 Tax=Streptomyces halobius TaxID=2879846 RepID=A0ABY4M413_9ACTN|nr:3-oxoacyl-[acyl-carrier-protein] synthase III C-terminal domain-containing protein [Streptomyces halobius]UQA92147.1 3-oxoacyl-ACP synthase [Streptomyces halobius]